ncbi:hypothetical protein ACS0TY_034618 [Phlomoides rotata]
MYHKARKENLKEISERNVELLKGLWKRLSENSNKWIIAYKKTYRRKRSGMRQNDIEKEAHSIYETGATRNYFGIEKAHNALKNDLIEHI